MPLINLIHEQRQATRNNERKERMALAGLIATAVVSAGAWGTIWFAGENTKNEAAELQAQVDKLKPIKQAIQASEMQFNALSPRLATLQDAAMSTQRWGRVMDHLSHNVPNGVWLTQVKCLQAAVTDPVSIELQGLAPSQELASEFILRVQASEDLENVVLKSTSGDQVNERQLIRFEVKGDLVGTAKAAPAVDEKSEEKK
ncbi:MAG: PilN domain-containing protein [Fimbriimonadaceae bacterium]|nr:PilN domain-containing protein [Fimbriimonadaceae bacterium]